MNLKTRVDDDIFVCYADDDFKDVEIGIFISNAEIAYILHDKISLGDLLATLKKAKKLFIKHIIQEHDGDLLI